MRFNCEKKETIYQGGEGQRLREARALLPEDSEPILRKRKQVARSQGHVHERGLVSERHLGNNTQNGRDGRAHLQGELTSHDDTTIVKI